MKIDDVKENILTCAKEEFSEKGYEGASMRTIAERAGYTTGMLYSRFADKDEIFGAIVGKGADALLDYFNGAQSEFAAFEPTRQKREMHTYVNGHVGKMLDIIYDNFDAFKLIVCRSAGSSYEHFVEKMVEIETAATVRFIRALKDAGVQVNDVGADLNHMLTSALFNGIFEIVAHDFPKEAGVVYVARLFDFFNAGWDKLLGVS